MLGMESVVHCDGEISFVPFYENLFSFIARIQDWLYGTYYFCMNNENHPVVSIENKPTEHYHKVPSRAIPGQL